MITYIIGENLDELIKHVKKTGKRLPENKIFKYFVGILYGLAHIHQNDIVHKDIKPDNIMINSDGAPKIADYGISKSLEDGNIKPTTNRGTREYMSPELLRKKNYDTKTDIWSLGCILHELCHLNVRSQYELDTIP